MKIIDFNNFKGFDKNEDILIDTGVLFALFDKNDAWHKTVSNLFDRYIFNSSVPPCLYTNPCIICEVTNLLDWEKSFKRYNNKHPELNITESQVVRVQDIAYTQIKTFIQNGVLISLNLDKECLLLQLDLFRIFGATDAANLSLVNQYGISFLTVDNKLIENIHAHSTKIPNIKNVYCTPNNYRTY